MSVATSVLEGPGNNSSLGASGAQVHTQGSGAVNLTPHLTVQQRYGEEVQKSWVMD